MLKKKIFYLDDDPSLIDFIKFALEQYDYEVITAPYWEDKLLDIIQDVDLVLLDIIPEPGYLDGFEICKLIKKEDNLKDIPVFLFSGKKFSKDKRKTFEIGADNYLEKPISVKKLVSKINKGIKEKLK
ncbi:MAG: response regulator [Fusobacteriota bacterium]